MVDKQRISNDFAKVLRILDEVPSIRKDLRISKEEFHQRAENVYASMKEQNLEVGLVFSDEHYCGDVPYLCGNCNITIEQTGAVVGATGAHLIAGLEGGYAAEQLAMGKNAGIHKAELLQLADEKYPVAAETFEDILKATNNGSMPKRIALLTPRQVIPASLVEYCESIFGRENVIDAQELYFRQKYEKSEMELQLVR